MPDQQLVIVALAIALSVTVATVATIATREREARAARDAVQAEVEAARARPEVTAAVRRYYAAYADAVASCGTHAFLKAYPHVAEGGDPASGVNDHARQIDAWCGQLHGLRFELEHYEPMRLHEHADGIDVTVHGVEHWDYIRGGPGGGEFLMTLTLRPFAGGWTVVRTDEVTLGEWHERH